MAPVVQSASAHEPTGATAHPHCATPGCTLHAVFDAAVDVHFPVERYPLTPRPRRLRTTYLACLPCYGRLRHAQADGYVEILAVEAL